MMGHWNEKPKGDENQQQPKSPGVFKALNHPALFSLRVQQCESLDSRGRVVTSMQTVLTCTKIVPPRAMRQVVQFAYTGTIDPSLCDLGELKQAAEFLNLPELYHFVLNLMTKKQRVEEMEEQSVNCFRRSLEFHFLCQV